MRLKGSLKCMDRGYIENVQCTMECTMEDYSKVWEQLYKMIYHQACLEIYLWGYLIIYHCHLT